MRKIGADELKSIQIDILDKVAGFCDEAGIRYWIDSGTLLGAIRHKGYIPWDDDIDIGMLREDYERFYLEFNKKNSRYRCCTFKNTKGFPYPFAKVLDTDTELYEPSKEKGVKISINIDIFVYDNAPSDPKELKKAYDRRDKYFSWYQRRVLSNMTTGNILKRTLGSILRFSLKLIPVSYFRNKVDFNQKRYNGVDTGHVGNFSALTRMICEKEALLESVEVEFEGKTYKAPKGYDKWLRSFYGDYMQLPPPEKRVSNHVFEAFVKE